MFVDASAVVAILRREAGWEHLAARLEQSDGPILFSPIVVFEATVSLARQSVRDIRPTPEQVRAALAAVTAFIDAVDGAVVEITPNMGTLAIQAASTYGKAVGHPADLNFGDCFTYACARALSQPLLYKGNDFAQTDIG